jgi:hypothetical protein
VYLLQSKETPTHCFPFEESIRIDVKSDVNPLSAPASRVPLLIYPLLCGTLLADSAMPDRTPLPPPTFHTNVPPSFFTEYFHSVTQILRAKSRGMRWQNQNPADIGELSETFLKEVLQKFFGGVLRAHRGGKIISADRKESQQIDVLLTGQNTLALFEDKGVYPVETVFGAFAITSTLDLPKLKTSITNLASIPNQHPRIVLPLQHPENIPVFAKHWRDNYPLRCVFGFDGPITASWIDTMIEVETTELIRHEDMPALVIVNERGVIVRGVQGQPMASGAKSNALYHFVDFQKLHNGCYWVSALLARLYDLSKLQHAVFPDYIPYFNPDLENGAFLGFIKGEIDKMFRGSGIEPPDVPGVPT